MKYGIGVLWNAYLRLKCEKKIRPAILKEKVTCKKYTYMGR